MTWIVEMLRILDQDPFIALVELAVIVIVVLMILNRIGVFR